MTLGTFSYGLYLIHWPLLVGLPVVVLPAFPFHLAFEWPVMSAIAPKTKRRAEAVAVVSPAT